MFYYALTYLFSQNLTKMYFVVELYVTSEENYNGIVSMNWVNGLELKLSLEEWLHDFKIKGVRNEYLKLWTSCTDDFSNQTNLLFSEFSVTSD